RRRARARAVCAEGGGRARRRRPVAEPDRQYGRAAARCRSAATDRAGGYERDRAVVGDPAVPLGRVPRPWGAAESVAVPVPQAHRSGAAVESWLIDPVAVAR